jgi:hypothetical protein
VDVHTTRWRVDMSADEVRDLFSTFTGWSDDDVEAAGRAVDDLGGRVTEHYVTVLYLCRVDPRGQPTS